MASSMVAPLQMPMWMQNDYNCLNICSNWTVEVAISWITVHLCGRFARFRILVVATSCCNSQSERSFWAINQLDCKKVMYNAWSLFASRFWSRSQKKKMFFDVVIVVKNKLNVISCGLFSVVCCGLTRLDLVRQQHLDHCDVTHRCMLRVYTPRLSTFNLLNGRSTSAYACQLSTYVSNKDYVIIKFLRKGGKVIFSKRTMKWRQKVNAREESG